MLVLRGYPGRLRPRCHLAVGIPVVAAAFGWFGITVAVPLMIWWWYRCPRGRPGPWVVELAALRRARLGPWRTRLVVAGQPAMDIFHDEVDGRELARLRRAVKAQLAAG